MFRVSCPACAEAIALPESQQGKETRCGRCGELFLARIPDPAAAKSERVQQRPTEAAPLRVARREEDRRSAAPPAPPISRPSSLWTIIGLVACGFLLLVLTCGVGLGFWLRTTMVPLLNDPAASAPATRGTDPFSQVRATYPTGYASCLHLCGDGTRLAVGRYDRTVHLFDVRTQQELAAFAGHGESITSVALSPEGELLAAADGDGLILIWDVPAGQRVHALKTTAINPQVRFLPDGKTLAVAGVPDGVALLDVRTWKIRNTLEYGREVEALDITPDGRYLAMGGFDVRVWDLARGKEVMRAGGQEGLVMALSLSGDGRVVASANGDNTVKVWDVRTGRERVTIRPQGPVSRVVMSPDGRLVASNVLGQGPTRMWDAGTGREVGRIDLTGPLVVGRGGQTLLLGASTRGVVELDLPEVGGR